MGEPRRGRLAWIVVMALALVAGDERRPSGQQRPAAPPLPRLSAVTELPLSMFRVADGLEVTRWAGADLVHNPTNIDIDKDGRVWVAEGVRYRNHHARQPDGDRIVVLEDTDGDGKADASHTFVQEPALVAPLGIAVIDNRIVVSQPPDLIVYTDVDRNRRFDPAVDTREVLLTGFQGINHDHSLHAVTVGPDGKWLFNSGNMGARFTDRSGRTFTSFTSYKPKPIGPFSFPHDSAPLIGARSDDGHVYVGGFTTRMNADGTQAEIVGYNYRNSYEQAITSLGDIFQSDNDDPPACRVSWVMEYANFGFSSNDGQRTWQADRRPGQSVPMAEWRQDDPGIAPAGYIYGGGSPTGTAFYENGALGPEWQGTFLAAEPGRNTIFAFTPVRDGAGFRFDGQRDLMATNTEGQWAGTDFSGGPRSTTAEISTLFRPSDVAIGADGALYVSDWVDPIVGFHEDLDDATSGAIYRIAPRGFVSRSPAIDASTIDGLVVALKSPAVNVRAIGFMGLKARGAAAVDAVAALLDDPNPYIHGRAVFLLNQLGPTGVAKAGAPDRFTEPAMRIAAFRAMRRADLDVLPMAARLARDADAGVRREVALAMRDRPDAVALPILEEVARRFDGRDRSYLEALGTGATGKEVALYDNLRRSMGAGDPLAWSDAFAWIAWRLHTPRAVDALARRASSSKLALDARRRAMDALAFINTRAASAEMVALASTPGPLKDGATWWVLNRLSNDWADHDLLPLLKQRRIYDPETLTLQSAELPSRDPSTQIAVADVVALRGDAARGRDAFTRCLGCHAVGGLGADVGPGLDGWTRGKSPALVAAAIVDPDAGIAHGYAGTTITTKDGLVIQGLLIKEGDPLMVRSMGGATQIVPADRVKSRTPLGRSLMIAAGELGMTAQDVADVMAFLREH